MNPRIENKESITLLGKGRDFSMATCNQEIPGFWAEYHTQGFSSTVMGQYGVSVGKDNDDSSIRYYIADLCAADATVPKGFEKITLPAQTWAVFEGRGVIPEALHGLLQHIYGDWLPTNGTYAFGQPYNVEKYTLGDPSSPDYRFEIWQSVRRV